jgi:hypothetical protein
MKTNYAMTVAIIALFAVGILFAQTVQPTSAEALRLSKALGSICNLAAALLPVVAFVLFILAGVAYAAGNFFGADARAKSVGWAMNMITGAVISFLLWIVGPVIISGLSGGTIQYSPGQTNCGIPQ